jgi:threonine/homoserine/homoserine lactone efflux protein
MHAQPLNTLAAAFLIAIIGALPFGLVNLTVLDVSFRNGKSSALKVAHGAAWIEVIFGFAALMAGSRIVLAMHQSVFTKYLVIIIPGLGVLFFLKKNSSTADNRDQHKGFIKGALFNLSSIQVLLYWLFAVVYVNTRWQPEFNIYSMLLFAAGIWLGKMGVLWIYACFSVPILSRSAFLAHNMNRIIGTVLVFSAIFQFCKSI